MAVKKATAPKKPAAKKAEVFKANVVLQYGDKSISYDEIVQNAKNVWAYDLHKDGAEIKSMELYVKPEEDRVYYVINGSEAGSFMI